MLEIKNNDISHLKDKQCLILFYFTASWCNPCQKIKPMIEKLSDGLEKNKIEIYLVDINENDELQDKLEINSVPTFFILHENTIINKYSGSDINIVHKLIKDNLPKVESK